MRLRLGNMTLPWGRAIQPSARLTRKLPIRLPQPASPARAECLVLRASPASRLDEAASAERAECVRRSAENRQDAGASRVRGRKLAAVGPAAPARRLGERAGE